ncbi:heavy metal translocating P-type ATPase [Pseudorhodoplanes sinuspersici]|uniref:Nitrogen fixation protein FixI n=1 Tax=Pseudorhodoplanes sinuspersici TaxID=1235591 RepID=A0A1W6ZT03_9HYPH|nr:heavy metal translocating P-type ATPase [Pseudorhodoplanes sinuspersici]ARQ00527.1 nitrogen fixation protein FixI [Pseudorhodoplanes sinuspersici]RKE67282.1 Cu2+-exporting ATPase [Pseudorhodoplanes sinuspersici]
MTKSANADYSYFTRQDADGVATMDLVVDGIHCGGCIGRIEKSLKAVEGIRDARLNFTSRRLTLSWSDPQFDPANAIRLLERMGYHANPFKRQLSEDQEVAQSKFLLRYVAVAGFAAMNIMLLSVSVWSGNGTDITPETRDLFHWLSAAIALPAAAYAGQPFFRSAWNAVKVRQVNMDVPISLGILLALGMSLYETIHHAEHAYFDSAVMLIFFLLCGRVLDQMMRRRTRAVAGNLAALKADTAYRLMDHGELVQIPAAALRIGDRILVRAGERIAADGIVLSGHAQIDESLITGETMPHKAEAGRQVYAGSINHDGTLTIRVTAAGENTFLDDIDRLLDKAVNARSRYVRLSDRIARGYAPMVHTAAALTFIGWMLAGQSTHDAIIAAISVLIITCPCALALAIPAVQVVAASKLFRSGVFLNSGDAIERLAEADIAIFDKTGTLTLPEAHLVNAADIDPGILALAGRLALTSRHPLARAIAAAQPSLHPLDDVTEEHGRGVRAMVDGIEARLGSPAFCAVDVPADLLRHYPGASLIAFRHGAQHAVFFVNQVLRPEATKTVQALARLGLEIRILSGDRVQPVEQVAASLGVTQWRAGLSPTEKVAIIETLKAEGRKVLMVGDGLNDAPSLAAANVSISPISAADLSQAQADAVFLGKGLTPVLTTVQTARHARRIMRQNLWLAIVYNIIAVPVAMAGLITPLIAAAAMSGSSILVTLNALRARGRKDVPSSPVLVSTTPAMEAA